MKQVTQSTLRFSRAVSVVLLAFAVALVVSGLALNAQVKEARTSMELGSVTVWLGMPKQEVVRRCASAGYSVNDTNDLIFDTNDPKKATADSKWFGVKFKNGRLSFASREWYSSKASPFGAAIGALEQLKDTHAGCSVVHDQDKSPDAEFERVFITCGFRTVLIKVGKMYGEPVADVWEQIDSER